MTQTTAQPLSHDMDITSLLLCLPAGSSMRTIQGGLLTTDSEAYAESSLPRAVSLF